MPVLDLPTHPIHYRIDATGPDKPWLTLCNSLGTDLHMWDAQIDALSPHFRILRHDRRGHGRSGAPQGPFALADLGRDVLALWEALSIGRSHFCGLSIGGLTGQWLGIHAGARLDRLVVCATAARIGTAAGWQARMTQVQGSGLGDLVAATAERWFSPGFRATHPDAVQRILDGFAATSVQGYLGCCAALAGADLRQDLGRIAAPLLAVSGQDDPVCPPDDLADIARAVPDGRHVSLPGRHLVNLESAAAFNAALTRFLTGHSPDPARPHG